MHGSQNYVGTRDDSSSSYGSGGGRLPRIDTPRYKRFVFTLFDDNLAEYAIQPSDDIRYYIYQRELAPTTQREHLQGYMETTRQITCKQVKQILGSESVHVEHAIGSAESCILYCSKLDTRVAGPVHYGIPSSYPGRQGNRIDLQTAAVRLVAHKSWEDVVRDADLFNVVAKYPKWAETLFRLKSSPIEPPDIVLRTWQLQVLEILEAAVVKRRIIWIWSHKTGTGKTTFYDYCCCRFRVLPGAAIRDAIAAYDGHTIIWFDRTRSRETAWKDDTSFYSDLEQWSNGGYILSTKYVPCRKLISCHVVVTSNNPPHESELPGRFLVVNLDE